MMKCKCQSCGITKVRFVSEKEGGSFLPLAGAIATMPIVLGGLALDSTTGHILSKGIGNALKKKAISCAKAFGASSLRGLASKIEGKGLDIHKAIGKIPHGKHGFTLPGHHYTGPYNDLSKQLTHDDQGNILKVFDQPTGKTDAVSMQHDIDYSVCKDDVACKNKANRKMVKVLDSIPWKERQWGQILARNATATKAKLGFGNLSANSQRKGKKEDIERLQRVYYSPEGYWKGLAGALSRITHHASRGPLRWPKLLQVDPGREFMGVVSKQLAEHKVKIRRGRVNIHRDQGIVKRWNRTLAERLFGHQYAQ